jgi:hypothetical protein
MALASSQQRQATTQELPQSQPSNFDGEQWLDATLAKAERLRGGISLTEGGGLKFDDFAGVQRYANIMVQAGMVPLYKDDTYEKQLARTIISINLGRRVGLSPEESVASIYVVNCRPVIFGDAPLAICRQHPAWVESGFEEYFEVNGHVVDGNPKPEDFKNPSTRCVVKTLRKGAAKAKVSTFSVADAQAAGLFGRNANLYGGYPHRMLKFRARGYALRDNFGDALKGLGVRELGEDRDEETTETPAPAEGTTDLRSARHEANGTAKPIEQKPEAKPTPDPADLSGLRGTPARPPEASRNSRYEPKEPKPDPAEVSADREALLLRVDAAMEFHSIDEAGYLARVWSRKNGFTSARPASVGDVPTEVLAKLVKVSDAELPKAEGALFPAGTDTGPLTN